MRIRRQRSFRHRQRLINTRFGLLLVFTHFVTTKQETMFS